LGIEKTVSTASSELRRNRVMSAVMVVTGPPEPIWARNSGMTERRCGRDSY